MPQLGETVTEGTITRWFKGVGETVARDEVLFEVSTDKVDTEVPSPAAGVLAEIRVPEGETVEVGTILAVLSDGAAPADNGAGTPAAEVQPPSAPAPAAEPAEAAAPAPAPPPPAPAPAPAPAEPAPAAASAPPAPAPPPAPAAAPQPAPAAPAQEPAAPPEPAPAAASAPASAEGRVLSPVVRRLIAEYGIDPDEVAGTGLGGRISRDDVQRHIETNRLSSLDAASPEPAAAPEPPPAPAPAPAQAAAAAPSAAPAPASPVPASASPVPASAVQPGARDAVVPLSNIRLRTGEHMVMSKSVAPHTLTAIEVDYEAVEQVRKNSGDQFKAEEGFSLTYLPFISRAAIDALREYPHLNASVGDRELVVHNYVNLGIAVDLDFQGLLAPVVRDADGKRLRSIARDIVDVARRARSKQLSPDELSGGTFTLTNAGSYGTMMQFPIINQPQVAILSTDAVKRKPVVIEDDYGNESIVIHSVGVLAMAWDHRAIDGAYAAAFLARVKEILETRDWESELG